MLTYLPYNSTRKNPSYNIIFALKYLEPRDSSNIVIA